MKKNKGFTIIELIIAMVILGVITMLAMDSLRTYIHNEKIRTASVQVLQALKVAQIEAIRRNGSVSFNISGNSWESVFTSVSGAETTLADGHIADDGISLTSSENSIVFGSNGYLVPLDENITIDIDSALLTCGATEDNARCLEIIIKPGGQSKLCDPTKSSGDMQCV